ncbi:MAG: cupin domain-containing protein [bacterium]|nr:cupin domain-containing protein [bacterium]
MLQRIKPIAALGAGLIFAAGFSLGVFVYASVAKTTFDVPTGVISWDDARVVEGDWGEMRIFGEGETYGTTQNLAAAAVVKPGMAVHPAHRHAEEEYLVLAKGSGMWRLNGKEFPAKEGDVLYVEPWAMHGLLNTGDEPLTFFVFKWNSKGVPAVPEPEGDHGR